MSWPARTWVTGELVTAALLNAQLRDNLNDVRAGTIAMTSQAALDFIYASTASQFARLAAGVKFDVPRIDNAGTAWEFAAPVWLRAFDNTQAATGANTSETLLYTYTAAASLFNATGRGLRLTAFGTFANNANTKTVRVRFNGLAGTLVVAGPAYATAAAAVWIATAIVTRTGSNTQRLVGKVEIMNAAANDPDRGNIAAGAITESGAIDLVVTGQNGTSSANDIVYECAWVEQLGPAE